MKYVFRDLIENLIRNIHIKKRQDMKHLDVFCTKLPNCAFRTRSRSRTGTRVNSQVFETSASTNSAIRALTFR